MYITETLFSNQAKVMVSGSDFLTERRPKNCPECFRRYPYLFFPIKCVYILIYIHCFIFLAYTYSFHPSLASAFNTCCDCFLNCQKSPPNCQIPLDLSVVSDFVVNVVALECSFPPLLSCDGPPSSLTEATTHVEPDCVQKLCDFGQVTLKICASDSLSVKGMR